MFANVPVNFILSKVSWNPYFGYVGASCSVGGFIVESSFYGSITGKSSGVINSHYAMTSNSVIESYLSMIAVVTGTLFSIAPVSLFKR